MAITPPWRVVDLDLPQQVFWDALEICGWAIDNEGPLGDVWLKSDTGAIITVRLAPTVDGYRTGQHVTRVLEATGIDRTAFYVAALKAAL